MNPEPYARALWKVIEGGMEPKKAVKAIAEKLRLDGRAKLIPRIARVFARIAEREMRRRRVVLSVARANDETRAKKAVRELLKEFSGGKDAEIELDESLIGGWRLEGSGLLVDESFKKALLSIYNRAIRS